MTWYWSAADAPDWRPPQRRVTGIVLQRGRVVGADTEGEAGTLRFKARGSVVLAAEDLTNSPEHKVRFMGPQETKVEGVNLTVTSDGQRMAKALGARIVNGDLALGPELRFNAPALAPSTALFDRGALLVNQRGERFGDELDRPAWRLPDQPGKMAYILIDQALASRFSAWPDFASTAPGLAYAYIPDYAKNRSDVYTQAATLDALAHKLGMDPEALAHSVSSTSRLPLGAGPYVALGPVRSVFVHSEGGLMVDQQHRVLGAGDQPLPGLYAAGSTGQGGLLLKGHGHHLAWAFVSGRRAGRFAARAASGDWPQDETGTRHHDS